MKGAVCSLLGVFVIACTGCGGGGSDGPTPAAQVKKVAPVAIDMEGDSLIWGYTGMNNGVPVQSTNSPPKVVQTILQEKFGPTVTTLNNAVNGTTVANSLYGQGYPAPFPNRVGSIPAQIILSDYATNDSVQLSLADYTAALIQWVQNVKSAGKLPVLEEPNPSCAAKHASLGQYRDAMVSVAHQQGVPLITQYDYILSLPDWQSMLQPDCTHPTDALYLIKAKREAEQLAPIVQSLQ
ncbi:SGNH/GDSL hydrolase family protein [Paraburkholderia phenoliruptrix]|uniref:SGNH/GDSL hydrolase family protein n=1 Tax=Paraburkholderia phenoliruptrix TaxID=252970 RepID=UPI001C6E3261|nr:SGNH/GDSL hydrolase family protein [Paraburkholderia phenoliruptrix]MBW9102963.1 SGNH/GDSL hydrolase family protein [Paraburkholderia phenoliruptrix]MBW9132937.1 SGNH/GDSL hydrolase family protein [Paraburkholderia ginsengiterrae]